MVDKDLEASFAQEFPSAAKKLTYLRTQVPQPDDIVPSVEATTAPEDVFMAELMQSAAAPTPTLGPKIQKSARNKNKDTRSRRQGHDSGYVVVDLSNASPSQSTPETPTKKRRSVQDVRLSTGREDEEDEIVVSASGRRKRVRLAMRILSVQELDG